MKAVASVAAGGQATVGLLAISACLSMIFMMNGANAAAPEDLSNYQGIYPCQQSVRIGRPRNYPEVLQLIRKYEHVKGSGVGHSWWGEQFCSGSDSNSVNIMLTAMERKMIMVNEKTQTVRVSSGVKLRDLMDYLAEYRTPNQDFLTPGYALNTFSWFIDQTVGGAVATGTHGSSMRFGSLSEQVVAMTVALPNGTMAEITDATHPHLMKAMRVSVGRLGIILDLTFKIVRNSPVRRTATQITSDAFVRRMKTIQEQYIVMGDKSPAVKALGETQLFWNFLANNLVEMAFDDFSNSSSTSRPADDNAIESQAGPVGFSVSAMNGPSSAWESQAMARGMVSVQRGAPIMVDINPAFNFLTTENPLFSNYVANLQLQILPNGIFPRRNAYISQEELVYGVHKSLAVYDQYEVAVPLDRVGDCVEFLTGALNAPERELRRGFPIMGLVRFVKNEDSYLSPTNGGARMYLNIEDYLTHSPRYDSNPRFEQVMKILRSPRCDARLHWGKAGWPVYGKDFDGSKEYPRSWCDFGCVVRELDPDNKFAGMSNVWDWNGINLGTCCSEKGFSNVCTCAVKR